MLFTVPGSREVVAEKLDQFRKVKLNDREQEMMSHRDTQFWFFPSMVSGPKADHRNSIFPSPFCLQLLVKFSHLLLPTVDSNAFLSAEAHPYPEKK